MKELTFVDKFEALKEFYDKHEFHYVFDCIDGNATIVDGRYFIYDDGVIFDNEKAEDIPEEIFKIRDYILKIKLGGNEQC